MVEEIGYTNVFKLFYKVLKMSIVSGSRFINDDKDITKMLGFVKNSGVIDVYVEHHTSETENEGGLTQEEGLGVTT